MLHLHDMQDEDLWNPGSTKPFRHPNVGTAAAVGTTTVLPRRSPQPA
ncbi:hypothetical protein ACCUM_3296 [Candidatus Accumulibacter phosphatis]|uniref:Uncharacterized protein n=1 Tax=Candidatus Accumulibacter phosphatis TaxID=327160 RepID=A0A5S4EPS4_9PROT|nr:hypothetical protein ACCUM_3296 [Candidatus Accumulibacter phosphatis]